MSSHATIKIHRNSETMTHESFYNLLNGCAEKHDIKGQVSISRDSAIYKFQLQGPTAALQQFFDFVRFAEGPLGKILDFKEEDQVVPQAADDSTGDAVVPEFSPD